MIRLVRAFAWLRFRLVVGALRQGWRRGGLSAFSAWAQAAASVLLGLVVLAIAAGLAWLAWLGAPALVGENEGTRAMALLTLRAGLVVPLIGAVLMPFVVAASGAGHARPRLLLLPIPEGLLHALELAAAVLDPWIFLATPALVVLAAGLARCGRPGAAALVLAGTALFALVLAALSTLVASVLQIVLRDRRRAEALTVAVMVLILGASAIPALVESARDARREASPPSVPEAAASPEGTARLPGERARSPADLAEAFPTWLTLVPSEAQARVVAGASAGRAGDAGLGLAVLALEALVLVALSGWSWSRLTTSAQTLSRRRAGRARARIVRLPLCSAGASAVALAFARGAVRTVQGKLALLMPPVTVGIFSAAGLGLARSPEPVLAFAGVAFVLLYLQSFLLNQHAMEGAGLARQLLSPLSAREVVRGKLAGGALLSGGYSLACLAAVAVFRHEGPPVQWLAAWVGSFGAYLPLAATGALVSAVLPRRVDLSKLGKAAQPHQLAMLAGMVATPLAVAPPALLAWMGLTLQGGAWTALGLEVAWLVLVVLVAWPIERAAAGLLEARAETILLEATRT